MKYYDGMGRDVTDYVIGLEKKLADLEKQSAPKVAEPMPIEPINLGILEEPTKPKKRKVTTVADTE